ncbi:MAG: periplasmic heavy metal sensor [Dechloromonas sp.]|nr:periplasmic heavy metal sensor [Dechloromonas sp.]
MTPSQLRIALLFSICLNIGAFGAVAYRSLMPAAAPAGGESLPRHLQLSPPQLDKWHALERSFLQQLAAGAEDIRSHRDRMIQAIFAEQPDSTMIDAERAAIARLQDEQQKLVIRQLLSESELLNPRQRDRLVRLLLAQPVGMPNVDQLHRD